LKDDKSTHPRGKIVVRIDNIKITNDEARFKLSANLFPFKTLCCDGENHPYYVISRIRDANTSGQDFVRVFSSQVINNTVTPVWNPQKIKLAYLCNGDKNLQIKFGVYSAASSGNH
jgi:hypothetical protein